MITPYVLHLNTAETSKDECDAPYSDSEGDGDTYYDSTNINYQSQDEIETAILRKSVLKDSLWNQKYDYSQYSAKKSIKYSYHLDSKDIAIGEAEALDEIDDVVAVKKCSMDICSERALAKGLCRKHYRKALNLRKSMKKKKEEESDNKKELANELKDSTFSLLPKDFKMKLCSISDCNLKSKRSMLCEKHYKIRNKTNSKCSFINDLDGDKKCRSISDGNSGYCRKHFILTNGLSCTHPNCGNKEIYNFTKCLCRSHCYRWDRKTSISVQLNDNIIPP